MPVLLHPIIVVGDIVIVSFFFVFLSMSTIVSIVFILCMLHTLTAAMCDKSVDIQVDFLFSLQSVNDNSYNMCIL